LDLFIFFLVGGEKPEPMTTALGGSAMESMIATSTQSTGSIKGPVRSLGKVVESLELSDEAVLQYIFWQ
jgi:hypothetical protein